MPRSNEEIAERICDRLFTVGDEQAEGLVRVSVEGRALGGWCRKAVRDQVLAVLREETDHAD